MEFALIIKLILLGIMLLSGLSYLFQRSGHKQNLQNAIKFSQAVRQLDDEEYQLLKPYLDDKAKVRPYKYQSSLISRDVTVITGPCVRHSLSTNGAESSYYFVIGDIEVFLPYGMESYTMSDNVAEVVFTQRYAFVVNLNGYSLATAKADRDAESLRNEQWEQGSRGQFKTVTDEDISRIEEESHNDAQISSLISEVKNRRCEILEQREETPLEAARKNPRNLAIITVFTLILAVVFALIYETDSDLGLLVVSVVCLLIAGIFYFHKPKFSVGKVNRVRGTIGDKDGQSHTILIGDTLSLSYPKHWQNILPEKTTVDIDMDVSVVDKTLLRYGNSLSISKEIEHYGAPKFWGRNCFILIVGLVLLLVISQFSSSLRADGFFTYRLLSGQLNQLNINDSQLIRQTTIQNGDWIDFDIPYASCDAAHEYRCDKVFIFNDIVDVTSTMMALPEWVQKVAQNSLVITKRDQEIETLETYDNLFSRYYGNRNQSKYTKLLNIEQLVLVTDEACQTEHNSCSRLKEMFTILLTDEQDNKFATWPEVVTYAKSQDKVLAIIYQSSASEIVRLFSDMANDILTREFANVMGQIGLKQAESTTVVINLLNTYRANVVLPNQSSNSSRSNLSYALAIAAGEGRLEQQGIVSDVSYHDDGSLASITINPDLRYKVDENNSIPLPLVTFVCFSVVAVITVLQLLIIINALRVNRRRLHKIQQDYRNLIL